MKPEIKKIEKRLEKRGSIDFGDYVAIEQKRFGVENEIFLYKVIGTLESNGYVDIPVRVADPEVCHDKIVPVAACVCCGVSERTVCRFRISDLLPVEESKWAGYSASQDIRTLLDAVKELEDIAGKMHAAIVLGIVIEKGSPIELKARELLEFNKEKPNETN